MAATSSDLPLSPTALTRFLDCEHRTHLDILERRGELGERRRPPDLELLSERGMRHEDAILQGFLDAGRDVVLLAGDRAEADDLARRTAAAMAEGREILHQACFLRDGWIGYPDFLVRVDAPSELGAWSYEVFDAKLSRHAEPRHIFQLVFYTDELARLQGVAPQKMHLLLGDGATASFRPEEFAAYAGRVRAAFLVRHAELCAPGAVPAYPYEVAACGFCHWWHVCDARRRRDDHVSLTAGVHRSQGLRLEAAGVHTLPALATLPVDRDVPRVPRTTVGTLRAQAGLQLRSRGLGRPLYELLEPAADRGLGRLPLPSAGDVHFDFEGDPNWGDDGLEYLFGTVFEQAGGPVYRALWATSRAEEKQAFETWIDWLGDRLRRYPDLHVFHYNAYETVALKRLVARHATREAEVDDLLRRRVFVDLYGITRQAIRAGTEGYGLKALEPVFGFQRDAELRGAIGSLRRWQAYGQDGDPSHLDGIAGYNEDDCLSTRALYAWLLERRPDVERVFGAPLAVLTAQEPRPRSDRALAQQARTDALRDRLLAGLPDDESGDDAAQRARRLAFHLAGYHRRESKPVWWALFARRERTLEELRDEDPEALSGLEVLGCEEVGRGSRVWTLRYPEQEFKLTPGKVDEPLAGREATLESVDEAARIVVVRRGPRHGTGAPLAIGPAGPYDTPAQTDALHRFAEGVADAGTDRPDPGLDLLLARSPRFAAGTPPLTDGPVDLERLKAQVRGLDRSVLVVQGPPGTGKTWTGARLAVDLLAHGRRVGIMATSHKAINNLVAAVDVAADEAGVDFRGWKKCAKDEDAYDSARVTSGKAGPPVEDGPVALTAATAWHWASADARRSVDVLLVDEAGQVSLADAIATTQAAGGVVLLGDPQQLAHVSQGTHPLGTGGSVLEHVLGDHDTIPPERGVLLAASWRMHPEVCGFISETMYDGRLVPVPGCEVQRVDSPGLSGHGLRLIEVEHEANRGRSPEEADRIASELELLLDGGTCVGRDGRRRPLTLDDVLVVAPYNLQVRCLKARLPEGARVGTVDRFQGQEAPVVLFSMASSSGEDVSRGMGFLFSRNRLNVAVSRAQALAVVVCSPALLGARCTTVQDMRLVTMLCRFADAAGRRV
ncbi:TM0106 family RecB-like putative nuclease [Baekduia soli]|uniref:TM0106 family RecB-like putative nuclease n=1 Tax=Baekduia soli TaxID=496014 RepID=A0A5B8U4G2_9ACTN|nr:TM0106 family RecB-like putative nuclease [Baekduia soli]QEC47552.1 TM0106 family RecB-like putative nuclease [Baekduia soli]